MDIDNVFDPTPTMAVQNFSVKLTALLKEAAENNISANVIHTVLCFHVHNYMEQIVKQASERVKLRKFSEVSKK